MTYFIELPSYGGSRDNSNSKKLLTQKRKFAVKFHGAPSAFIDNEN